MNPLEREKKDIIKYLDSPVFFLGWLSPPPAVLLFRLTFQLDDEARSFSDVAATLVCCHNKRDMGEMGACPCQRATFKTS